MNNQKIVKIIISVLSLIVLVYMIVTIRGIYLNKIIPIKEKISYYEKLQIKNKILEKSIKEEKERSKNIDKIYDENELKKEELEKVIYEHESKINGKVIYLTFDDGPSIYTDEILNILDKYNVKATFFVVCSKNLGDYAKKYIEKGHTIALHTCSHKYKEIYSSEEAYFNDLNSVSKIIEDSTGFKSKYVRFPGGSSNTVSKFNKGIMTRLSNELTKNGYKYFDWNIDSNDAGGSNSEQIYSNVIGALENNNRNVSMVLMHDTKVYTKDSLENIIKKAIELGYTFSNINDYTPLVHHRINN